MPLPAVHAPVHAPDAMRSAASPDRPEGCTVPALGFVKELPNPDDAASCEFMRRDIVSSTRFSTLSWMALILVFVELIVFLALCWW